MLSFFKHFPAKRHVPGVLHVLHGLKPPPLFLDPYAISANPFVRCHEVIEVLISQPLYDLCSCRLIEVKTLAQPLLMDRHRDAGDTHHLTLAHIIRCVAAVLQIIEESLCDMLGVFPYDIIALLQVLGVDPKQRAFDIGPIATYDRVFRFIIN